MACVPEIRIKQEPEEYNDLPEGDTDRETKCIGDICRFLEVKVEKAQGELPTFDNSDFCHVNDTEEHESELENIKIDPEHTESTEKGQSEPGKEHTGEEWSRIRNRLVAKSVARSQSKLFPCDFPGCGRVFRQSGTLRVHIRRHTREEQYKCEFEGCGRSFAVRNALKCHMCVHTGEKAFRCEFEGCDRAFYQKPALEIHRLTHTGERPFQCEHADCKSTFPTKSSLRRHLQVHTGERRFQCSFPACGQMFGHKHHLQRHLRGHTGERPFKCTFEGCGAGFRRKHVLDLHASTHTGKPYKGPVRKHASSSPSKQKQLEPTHTNISTEILGKFRLIAPKAKVENVKHN